MAKVTELQYYLHNDLKEVLDLCVKRHEKKWDNLLIIDGMERAGKTTLGKTIGHYVSNSIKVPFSLNNAFFDVDALIEYARTNRNKVIIWDEAALGGMGKQWQSKVQQKLVQMLMTCGKYGHFYIFIIPSFFELTWYLAVHRSIALINVYSEDLLTRGNFCLFNINQKKWIYNNNKKSETYGKPTFLGDFTVGNSDKIWNDDEYEKKKDDALATFFSEETPKTKTDLRVNKLKKHATETLTLKEACKRFDIDPMTYYNWKKIEVEGDTPFFEPKPKIKVSRYLGKGKNPEGLPL